jgi:hypothetical protein
MELLHLGFVVFCIFHAWVVNKCDHCHIVEAETYLIAPMANALTTTEARGLVSNLICSEVKSEIEVFSGVFLAQQPTAHLTGMS